jgi:hypothetical protein
MKGVVFTEFLGYVGNRWGEEMADDIVEDALPQLATGGAYTTVGTYDPKEMAALTGALAARSGVPPTKLVRDFGEHLSASFARLYPEFYRRAANYFDFLESIEGHIHVEVRKLYPDAELPTFTVESRTPDQLVMLYRSPRRLGALSEGLIAGSAMRFGVQASVCADAIETGDGQAVRFTVDLIA